MVTAVRSQEFASVRDRVRSWASRAEAVVAVALVGSWVRGEARMDSDIDVVVLVTDTSRYVEHKQWVAELFGPGADLVRTAEWGVLVERRVRLPSGLEVEFGFVAPSWAAVAPVDPGTRRVASDGCVPWYDPQEFVAKLVLAVAE